MTPQEKQLLERFLEDMVATRAGQRDAEAEAMIREAVSRQPDAAYLLVQRALQLDQALQITQAEAQKAKDELARAKSGTGASAGSFLGGDAYAWGSQPKAPGASGQPGALAAGLSPQARQTAGQGWGGSGMLGTVASTAAGVVAGSFLFQGIQNLLNRNDTPEASTAGGQENQAQGIAGDSTGFEEVVPDDSDLLAGAGDDGDVV